MGRNERPGPKPADPRRALELYRTGLTWRQVGVELAREMGRAMPFTIAGMHHIIRRAR